MKVVLRVKNPLNSLLIKAFFSFYGGFVISGCVSAPPEVGALEYHYRCTGRFTFVNEAQAFSASYELSKYPTRLEIQFWGPLGQGRTRLVGRDKLLTIDLPSGERIEGMDAEMIMVAVLGWSVPLEALSDWILGRPDDEWPVTNHSPDSFTQLGWEIDLGHWGESSGRLVPARVVVVRGDSKIVLVIQKWMFGSIAH